RHKSPHPECSPLRAKAKALRLQAAPLEAWPADASATSQFRPPRSRTRTPAAGPAAGREYDRECSFDERHLVDFLQRGDARSNFLHGRFAQKRHSLFPRQTLDLRSRTAVQNQFADLVA